MSNLTLLPSNAVEVAGARTFTTSLMVADVFGKQHKHVLRDIDDLDCSAEFRGSNFGLTFREISTGSNFGPRQERYFEITKDGFTLLVMGYTGAKAMQFKEAYIKRFNEMESQLRNTTTARLASGNWLCKAIQTPDFPSDLLPDVLAAVSERMRMSAQLTAHGANTNVSGSDILEIISSATIPVYGERFNGDLSVKNLVLIVTKRDKTHKDVNAMEAKRALGLCGLRVDGEVLLISNTNQAIGRILEEKQILGKWGKMIQQVPGAVKYPKPVKIQGATTRVVGVPINAL